MPRPIVRNSGPLGSSRRTCAVEIGDEIFIKVVVAGHRVALAALLAQPHPQPTVLRVDILDRHAERRADAGEGMDHEGDQRAIAHTGMRRDIDAIEQRARFRRIENRRLSRRHHMRGSAQPNRPG